LIAYFIALYFLRFFDSREIEKIKQVFKGFYGKVSTR
jgi:hypothetical protein